MRDKNMELLLKKLLKDVLNLAEGTFGTDNRWPFHRKMILNIFNLYFRKINGGRYE